MIELTLTENESKPFEQAINAEMDKTIQHYFGELIKIRTGRAHTSMIEDIPISCYGAPPVPLKGLAALSAPEVRLLTIQPWDPGIIDDIERTIIASDLGIAPVNDGKTIRLRLPEVSSERREELIKILHKKAEESKISIRNIRKEFHNLIRDAKKEKTISENFFNRLMDILQKITNKFISQVDEITKKKEQETRMV
ncbi:ribosome recycling factor [Candidatus Dependentiae bacterium]|nr:MAG: ribosome recycling factor [Candidatus Dependentiae bacterium]